MVFPSACRCNLVGSLGPGCSKLGGVCDCKANVIGRCCDACAPVTFGFGPDGCEGLASGSLSGFGLKLTDCQGSD